MTPSSDIPADLLYSALPFALLDDAQSVVPQSRLYFGLSGELVCANAQDWPVFLGQLEQGLQQGYYALAVLSYETGAQLYAIESEITPATQSAISRILLFRHCVKLSQSELEQFISQPVSPATAGIANVHASVDESGFNQAIRQIQDYIAAGDTYQVNYTYRLHFDAYGEPFALYQRLRARQPVPYGAFIRMPDGAAILSMSPELFVRHQDGQLEARPMKGTAAASGDAERDQQIAQALASDSKNRAENLMIVDLLRNDLGRIAETGSVKVPRLFEVSRFSSVLQMTSTVHARLREASGLAEILTALFPCGSITGAPKRRTMEIIREIETEPRGIYTGAIGWFDPPSGRNQTGNFCLSVPIRTLQLNAPSANADRTIRHGVMGVGAGIVYDSVATDEFAECKLKARFLTGLGPSFSLIETMYAEREQSIRYLELHLDRLRQSALYFGFMWDEMAIRSQLRMCCGALEPQTAHRLRLLLQPDGQVQLTHGILTPLIGTPQVFISDQLSDSRQLFLRHKTTVRAQYDTAWQQAERQGGFDMLFFNEQGHLTEGGRSNVFVKIHGRWLTPPLQDGVLPGVMRSVILRDPQYAASEQTITRAALESAESIMLCNALRGAFTAQLILT